MRFLHCCLQGLYGAGSTKREMISTFFIVEIDSKTLLTQKEEGGPGGKLFCVMSMRDAASLCSA